jgi:hypothetical protein
MNESVDLTHGGTCVVLHGATGFVKEFAVNPQVKFIKTSEVPATDLKLQVDRTSCKAIIMTDDIPAFHNAWVVTFCKQNKIPYLTRKSNQAVYDLLKTFFQNGVARVTPDDVQETQTKGKLAELIPLIDWNRSNAENARALERICNERKIKTTFGSLTQFVAVQRRKTSGVTAVPRSARNKLDVSVEMLDTMIKELTDMREFLIATVEENRLLKAKVEKFKKAFED